MQVIKLIETLSVFTWWDGVGIVKKVDYGRGEVFKQRMEQPDISLNLNVYNKFKYFHIKRSNVRGLKVPILHSQVTEDLRT